jgi:hypothetical protein
MVQGEKKMAARNVGPPQYSGTAYSAAQAQGMDINSIMAGWVDRGKWIYYDTITQAAGSSALSVYTPFAVGLNQNDQINTTLIKTKLQTNLPNGGQFNPPRCLILNQLGFLFTGQPATSSTATKTYGNTVLADIEQFCNSCYFEFRIDDKIFFEGLLEFHPPGVGIYGSSTNQNEESWGLGFPSPLAVWEFGNFAKYIAPLQNFSLQIKFPGSTLPVWATSGNGGQGINLVVMMKGLTDRSVQ